MPRGIRAARFDDLDDARRRVDTDRGLPRCERLAGNLTFASGAPASGLTCPCIVVGAPHPECPYATRQHRAPIELVDGWVYPVPDSDVRARAQLTAAQLAAIVDVPDRDVRGPERPDVEGPDTRMERP